MLDERLTKLLSILPQDKYLTADNLAEILNISSKTVRNQIKQLDEILQKNGAAVTSKHGYGYILEVHNFEKFRGLLVPEEKQLLDTSSKRVQYMLEYFLQSKDYVKMDDLSDMLCVCKKTLASDMKEVEHILEKYHISIERKPYYGMRIIGDEFKKRLCLAECVDLRNENSGVLFDAKTQEELGGIMECLLGCFDEHSFRISDVAVKSLAMHIHIAVLRIQEKNYVPVDVEEYKKWLTAEELKLAEECAKKIGKMYGVSFPEAEIYYIAIHLAGKKSEDYELDNQVISPQVNEVVTEMLEEVYRVSRIDFRSDLDLIMSLGKHMEPLMVRMQFGMRMRNPLLKDIKERFCLAYTLSSIACSVLTRRFGKPLDSDEIGYFALAFALSLERQHSEINKKTVLLVCSSGFGTAKLMSYKIEELFGEYIREIKTCELRSVSKMDFSKIDYIFTTVPIDVPVPVPICEVNYFMPVEDVNAMKLMLKSDTKCNVAEYYPADLFFTEIKGDTKEELIRKLCAELDKRGRIPEGFVESVLKRERLAQTAFGNQIAMPHPCQAMTAETFVCVCLLDHPIRWTAEQEVRVIFLVSVAENSSNRNKDFFRITSRFMLNKGCVSELLKAGTHRRLLELLAQLERNLEDERLK